MSKKENQRTKINRSSVKKGGQNEKKITPTSSKASSIYTTNHRLVEDAGRLAFAQALGNTFSLGSYAQVNFNNRVSGLSGNYIAGIARIGLSSSYGGTLIPTSALNIATRSIYSFVRHANAGHANYEAADLMLYLLQMNEILKLYSWFVRLYGISRTYNHKNRYYPKRIVEAMGVDFEDLIKNLASLRLQINVFANKVNSLNIPMNMPLFTESINLFSNLFLDGTDEKAQTYFFDLDTYYSFDAVTDPNGGMLKETDWLSAPVSKAKVDYLVTTLNNLLHAVLQNEDMNIMSGDILKAYGKENMLVLPMIPEDYMLEPVYDQTILTQIQNLTLVARRTQGDITQKNQLLVSNPSFLAYSPTNTIGKILTFKWDYPTPAEVIDATRLATIIPVTSTEKDEAYSRRLFLTDGQAVEMKTGTHIVTSLIIFEGVDDWWHAMPEVLVESGSGYVYNPIHSHLGTIIAATQFDYFPLRLAYYVEKPDMNYEFLSVVGDIQNYTILSKEDLDKQHEVAMLSLFGI